MSQPDPFDTLLSAWHQARANGLDPAAEELCRDCPALADQLAERIALLRQLSHLKNDSDASAANSDTSNSIEAIPTKIGDYRILGTLGQGGMGTVYRAEDERLCLPTALKVMRRALAGRPGALKRFRREARAAARVKHEAVVPILHVGEDSGVPYIAMPLLRGESLADRISRSGRLPPATVIRIGRDLAAGLEAIHKEGLIHRDIKPANIWLMQKDDGEGRAKILDFGLARFDEDEESRLTGTGDVLGTPAYMAPEQARTRDADFRADLFSLGCVFYHAATGRPPFRAPTIMGTLLAVANDQPPDPRTFDADLPVELVALINRLMAKTPAERPANTSEVVRTLLSLEVQKAPTRPSPPTHSLNPNK